jgi:hypothetical protein
LHAHQVVKQAPGVELAKPGGCEAELWVVDFQPGLKFEQTFVTVLLLFNFKLKIICIFFVGKN